MVRSELGRLGFLLAVVCRRAATGFQSFLRNSGNDHFAVYPMLGNMGLLSMCPSRDRKRQAFRPARLVNSGFLFQHPHQATLRSWP